MILRDSKYNRLLKLWRLALVIICALALSAPGADAKKKRAELPVEQSEPAADKSESGADSADKSTEPSSSEEQSIVQPDVDIPAPSLIPPLQGKTEVMEIILEEQSLYKQAMAAIDNEDFNKAVVYLQELIPQLGDGYEPYRAECMYYEAGCHQMLKRMNAATDEYKKAFELFEKYDSSNPLKGRAWQQYTALKPGTPMLDHRNSTPLQGVVNHHNVTLVPQRAMIAIDPNAVLDVRDSNRHIPVLEVNDKQVLPLIVKECFSDMTCLETAEIGSNVTNADQRWMPLMASGRTAAFGLENGSAHPAFRAKVNGRSYLFDVILPDLGEGQRKILLVTNQEKICAVDVDTFDTWLLRMQRAKDGRITTARWYKLTHKKNIAPTISGAAGQKLNLPSNKRNW